MTHCSTIRPGFNPLSVGLMILGFVFFWPLGLAMLAYILWGDRLRASWSEIEGRVRGAGDRFGGRLGNRFDFRPEFTAGRTGNVAFDEYRERELKRLEEERRRIDTLRAEFDEFLRNLRRAKDQEEFDGFMAGRSTPGAGSV